MNKYIVTSLMVLTCLLTLTACGFRDYVNRNQRNQAGVSGQAVSSGGVYMKDQSASHTSEPAAVMTGSGIHSADNVTAEMQTAEFWIGKTVARDKLLMTQSEIEEFNKKIMEKLSPDEKVTYYDLSKYGGTVEKAVLLNKIDRKPNPEKHYFTDGIEITDEQWQAYRAACNMDAIADPNPVRYGIVCSRADVRVLPTMDNITNEIGDTGHDVMQDTALAVNEPVLVLHDSLDGKWFYVIANEHAGWVLQDRIGLCSSKEAWQRAQGMDDFIVVTGDEVSIKFLSADGQTENLVFTMGTKLEIADETEYEGALEQRNPYDNYQVKVPVRGIDGFLFYQQVSVPLGKDVSHGFLEYTRSNVIRQAFKLLGNPYGWGGMNGDRDCSSMTRDIYLCFGFRLPRDASGQALIPGKGSVSLKGLSDKEKKEKLNSLQPGTILQMPGHVMIYLGCQDRQYYVINANGTFIPDHDTDHSKTESNQYRTRLVTVNDLKVKSPSNGRTWEEQIETIIAIP